MKNYYIVPSLLTIITLVELFITKDMSGSLILWVGYGIYRLVKFIFGS